MSTPHLVIDIYVGTGAKNAMYTLRTSRSMSGNNHHSYTDSYIRNLAATEELADQKAFEYFEVVKSRFADQKDVTVLYSGVCEQADKRRGKLSIQDTRAIETVETGVFPFGKHKDTKIADAPDGYILWLADMQKNIEELRPVMAALASIASGIAVERGLYAKREAARAEQHEKELKSTFVGAVGERREFEGEVMQVFAKKYDDDQIAYYVNRILIGDDIIVYAGNKLGEKGDKLKIKATIKGHNEYKGVKTTQVNRPKVL